MFRRFAILTGILLLCGCGGSGGPFITPPIGTLGYSALGNPYLGASMSSTTGHGSSASIRVIPTFNTPASVTVRLPGEPTLGTHLTSNIPSGNYYVRLDIYNVGEDEDGTYGSTSGGGTVEITAITPATPEQRGHVTGIFSSIVRNSLGEQVIITNGTFDADYDAPQ